MRGLSLTILLLLSCSPGGGGIVSLAPSADEIIVAVGGKDALKGVSTYSKVKGVPRVGDLLNPDYERLLSMRPDVVIVVLPMQRRVKERLDKLSLRTFDFSPESVEELVRDIRRLGKLVGREREADRLADSISRAVSSIKPLGAFTFYVELSSKPVFVAGDSTYIAHIVRKFGGKNLYGHLKGYAPVSTEDILSRKPDIVFTTSDPKERIGLNACMVRLKHDEVSPGLSIFSLLKTLERGIDSCLSVRTGDGGRP
ncbi:MAG: ABC transporter substrate-binding protein [Thermotogae bacterium]|nr:ABC transporter substrate-binding protein [Thermotogota bacterium]